MNDDITPERDLSLSTGLYSHEREDQEALHEAFPRTQMVSALVLPASSPPKEKNSWSTSEWIEACGEASSPLWTHLLLLRFAVIPNSGQ